MLGREDGIYQQYIPENCYIYNRLLYTLFTYQSSHLNGDQTTCNENQKLESNFFRNPSIFFWCKESFQLCEAMKEAGIAIQFLPSESIDRVVEVFCLWKLLCTNTIQCNSSAHSFFVKCPFPSFSNPCEVQLFLHSPLEWLDQWDMLT